ncbi:hypothetical protein TNCV_1451071 [Trichonephila clavipes]|nr:hypothetical protein TNCV_1451071 [Trichonephila clavipes]
MKSLVFETPVNSTEELVVRISAAAGEIRNTPEMLSNVRRSMKRRCEACITCGEQNIGAYAWYHHEMYLRPTTSAKITRDALINRYRCV